ncbi:hypothetical protein I79_014037 [Cricetulus griseus]|uniref:Uncharacterized protein n=1 Tax=Cricetulus griseus TaxID=10029 RepID=G3HT24_CRIGR|nr:hypothetical protein I79_014037 [Cricetulus griseus]
MRATPAICPRGGRSPARCPPGLLYLITRRACPDPASSPRPLRAAQSPGFPGPRKASRSRGTLGTRPAALGPATRARSAGAPGPLTPGLNVSAVTLVSRDGMLSTGPVGPNPRTGGGRRRALATGATGFPLAPPPNPTLPTEHAQLTCCNYMG